MVETLTILERLKEYAGFPIISRGTRGRLIGVAMRDARLEIEGLRAALRRLAIAETHRMAYGGGTVHTGYTCKVCKADWPNRSPAVHRADCLLASGR